MSFSLIAALKPKSLKQKTVLFILVPVFLIMVSFGSIGEQLVRKVLLEQWQETAITKLQRFAHYVDMRLMRPKEILNFLQNLDPSTLQPSEVNLMLQQLRSLDGVVAVNRIPEAELPEDLLELLGTPLSPEDSESQENPEMVILSPDYKTDPENTTVSLYAMLSGKNNKSGQYIEVILSFYDLIDQIVKSPWWKNNRAFIVDDRQNVLTSSSHPANDRFLQDGNTFDLQPDLTSKIWQAIQTQTSGTVFGKGSPPEQICGFFHLIQAPWTLVIISPGKQVLKPILKFRTYYFFIGWLGIIAALLYLRMITEKTTRAINKLSKAVENLAGGTFSEPITIESNDEVGTLTENFNLMSKQLQERMSLQRAMDIAREVQQNLLPQECFVADGLEVAGKTIYCDETGGDYIDLVHASRKPRRATIVVGDVVGHGIGAALLMATTRALLRGRAACSGSLEEVANTVNRLLCRDTSYSGNFVTLFYLALDRDDMTIDWVRCGHEPALLYCPADNSFTELYGKGLALGVDTTHIYEANRLSFPDIRQVIFIGSDGVWEVENKNGEMFGKSRVRRLIEKYNDLPAQEIVTNIVEEILQFKGDHPQNDDITLAIIKTW